MRRSVSTGQVFHRERQELRLKLNLPSTEEEDRLSTARSNSTCSTQNSLWQKSKFWLCESVTSPAGSIASLMTNRSGRIFFENFDDGDDEDSKSGSNFSPDMSACSMTFKSLPNPPTRPQLRTLPQHIQTHVSTDQSDCSVKTVNISPNSRKQKKSAGSAHTSPDSQQRKWAKWVAKNPEMHRGPEIHRSPEMTWPTKTSKAIAPFALLRKYKGTRTKLDNRSSNRSKAIEKAFFRSPKLVHFPVINQKTRKPAKVPAIHRRQPRSGPLSSPLRSPLRTSQISHKQPQHERKKFRAESFERKILDPGKKEFPSRAALGVIGKKARQNSRNRIMRTSQSCIFQRSGQTGYIRPLQVTAHKKNLAWLQD